MENSFFQKQTDSSRIKASIVAKYFPKYCTILLKKPQAEIRFLDLFSGPGKYEDGNYSTPLLVAESCAKDPKLKSIVRLMFNDMTFSAQLKSNFFELFPEGTFAKDPRFGSEIVGESEKIQKLLETRYPDKNPRPTLLFFDPFGYKGIDTNVLAKFLSSWGNEIFLFVNIKRINQAITVNKFDEMMAILFPTKIHQLRENRKYTASVSDRLALIMDNLEDEFRSKIEGNFYATAFKFQEEDSSATSHYILHLTKHPRGYDLVKQIYYDFDNIGATLVNSNTYTFDAKQRDRVTDASMQFGDDNIEELSRLIYSRYKGKTISAKALFEEHHPTTKWSGSHYAKTLRSMADKGQLIAKFTDEANHTVPVLLQPFCILKFN